MSTSVDLSIRTLHLPQSGIKIHAIPTGTVSVKRSHRNKGWGMLQILADFRWTAPMPVYCWCIEHPEGVLLFDTGENAKVVQADYFDCDSTTGWVNRKILHFEQTESMELAARLAEIGLKPQEVRWVCLSHLHIDHVDGLAAFPQAEVLVNHTEWQHPYGAVKCLLPNWLQPHLIRHHNSDHRFLSKRYVLTDARDISLVSTPGHTYGHQSLLIQCQDFNILLAGDVSFDQQQLIQGIIPGISADKKALKQTYSQIVDYHVEKPLIYLPSHDPQSGHRLADKIFLSNH